MDSKTETPRRVRQITPDSKTGDDCLSHSKLHPSSRVALQAAQERLAQLRPGPAAGVELFGFNYTLKESRSHVGEALGNISVLSRASLLEPRRKDQDNFHLLVLQGLRWAKLA